MQGGIGAEALVQVWESLLWLRKSLCFLALGILRCVLWFKNRLPPKMELLDCLSGHHPFCLTSFSEVA